MHDVTVIVHLTLSTIGIEIVISHILKTNTCSLSKKLSPTIFQIVVKRKQANG